MYLIILLLFSNILYGQEYHTHECKHKIDVVNNEYVEHTNLNMEYYISRYYVQIHENGYTKKYKIRDKQIMNNYIQYKVRGHLVLVYKDYMIFKKNYRSYKIYCLCNIVIDNIAI